MNCVEVSIIVAVYNIEQYIQECVQSICNIKRKDIEIILVDDGSTDSSGFICDELAKKDQRIKVIHQLNKGLPGARNSGLKIATGKWITFVDGDDYLSNEFEKDILVHLNDREELIFFGYKEFTNNRNLENVRFASEKTKILSEAEIGQLRLAIMNNDVEKQKEYYISTIIYTSTWGKLYRRSFIIKNKLYFEPDVSWGEDVVFTFKVLKYANRIKTIETVGYCYRIQTQSMTQKYDKNAIDKYLKFMNAIQVCVQNDNKIYKDAFWTMAAKQYLTIVRRDIFNVQNPRKLKERKKQYIESKRNPLIKLVFEKADLKKFNFTIRMGAIFCKYDYFYVLMILYKIQRLKDSIKYGI